MTTTTDPTPPTPTIKPGITTSEALFVLVAFLAILGISVGWIPTPPQTSALATQIVLAALAGVWTLARTYLKASAPSDIPPGVQSAISGFLSSLAASHKAPTPPPTATATERAPQSGRIRGSMLGVMSGVACLVCALVMGLGQPACKSAGGVGTAIGSAAGSGLVCAEADIEQLVGDAPLIIVVAEDLLAVNYQAAIDALIAQIGEPLVRCAIDFLDDVGGAIEGALVVTNGSGAASDARAAQRATIVAHAKAIRAGKGW